MQVLAAKDLLDLDNRYPPHFFMKQIWSCFVI